MNPTTSNDASYEAGSPESSDAVIIHSQLDQHDNLDESDVTTQIEPPEGFKPDSSYSPSTSLPKVSGYSTMRSNSSSASSHLSSSSSSNRNEQYRDLPTSLINQSSISRQNDVIQVDRVNPADINASRRDDSSSDESNGNTHVQIDNQQKDIQSKASTSSRIFDGFSNIVNKISRVFANSPLSIISTDSCLQDESSKFAFGNRRSLEKTWKLMDKVVKCCQRPGMNLNNSPPFILEILPETYQQLKTIHTKYDSSSKYPANDNEYSQVFLQNLQNRCKQTLKLFKVAKGDMLDEDSEYRHKLTRHTLVFNHILSELKAIFPNGRFIGERYLITKKETAGEFWKTNFSSSVLVDWATFYHALQTVHSINSSFFTSNALKQTIDLTCDDYISIFEFDVFTRLFQPWSTLLKNWQILAVTHPGYKAFLTYDELKSRLQNYIDKPGSYVYRLSCTRLGQWAIGYVTHDGQILQTIVQNISLSQALTETKFYLYPDGKDEDPNLNILCSEMAGEDRNVTVTEEQYEIYCGVGNPFQTCKICFENDKDIRVEPCNHLLCTSCLISWQESDGQGCPYCRTEIKETVQIKVDTTRRK